LFLNIFDVKTFLQLLFDASLNARDMLCSSMLQTSFLNVTSVSLQLFQRKYLCHTRHVFLH